jgi:hypothetical protein
MSLNADVADPHDLSGVIPPEKLELCPRCFELRGEEGRYQQRCRCEPPDDERWRKPSGAVSDFNKSLELCYCCAAEPIHSRSRWSVFYCDPCKELVMSLNRRVGAWIIPIVRHSVMHARSLSAEEASDREAVELFAGALRRLFEAIDLVDAHRLDRTRVNIRRLGFGTATTVPLLGYLVRAQPDPERAAAFEGLCRSLSLPIPD